MDRYRVRPSKQVTLGKCDPGDKSGFPGKREAGEERLAGLSQELSVLQEVLYGEHKRKVLIVLQAMDTGGKDGVVRRVFGPLNPQGVRVVSFKKPTLDELDHDFLWRVHEHVPGKGEIGIFNRSHYEDVLVVRVHELAPQKVLAKRYDHINNFERMLADEGTLILKFFLHIDAAEQKKRLQSRLDNPDKHWKLSPSDLEERKLWPRYTKAYETAISKTSTRWAPWYIVPANREWYRNLVVGAVMVEVLKGLNMSYPKVEFDPATLKIE